MQTRSIDTRAKILSTSYELFSQKGYDSTGVAEICNASNISKGAFYHHFASKQELFLTLIDTWLEDIDQKFDQIQTKELSPGAKLKFMSVVLNSIFKEASQIPMFLEVWMQSIRDPRISKRTIAPYYHYLSLFRDIFAQGIEDKSIPQVNDPQLSSRLIISFALGLIMQCMIEPNREDWQKISDFGIEKILIGLQQES